jgi:phosphoribosyl-AMP cyclohydrolase
MSKDQLENSTIINLAFDKNGLIPVITTDYITKEILMFAYMNNEALAKTIESNIVHYYSRSRQKIWKKGEESGFIQRLKSIKTDCDQDCLNIEIEMVGGACCHNGYRSCFYRELTADAKSLKFIIKDKVFDPKKIYK